MLCSDVLCCAVCIIMPGFQWKRQTKEKAKKNEEEKSIFIEKLWDSECWAYTHKLAHYRTAWIKEENFIHFSHSYIFLSYLEASGRQCCEMNRNEIYKPVELHLKLCLVLTCVWPQKHSILVQWNNLRETNSYWERTACNKNHCQLRNNITSVLDQTFNFFFLKNKRQTETVFAFLTFFLWTSSVENIERA